MHPSKYCHSYLVILVLHSWQQHNQFSSETFSAHNYMFAGVLARGCKPTAAGGVKAAAFEMNGDCSGGIYLTGPDGGLGRHIRVKGGPEKGVHLLRSACSSASAKSIIV